MRLLHTSDVHLGDGGDGGTVALAAVMDLGAVLQVGAILIAGDLFDHNRVSDREVAWFQALVESSARPVVVLPGNHDCYDESSVYRRPSFAAVPSNLHLLTEPTGGSLVLEDLNLEVWGRPTVDHHHTFRPLRDVPARRGDGWYVVMAHGHLVESPYPPLFSAPITPGEIAEAPCDYVALGHAEVFREVSGRPVRACYSGSPRVHSAEGQGTVAIVELTDQGVKVERHFIR